MLNPVIIVKLLEYKALGSDRGIQTAAAPRDMLVGLNPRPEHIAT